MIFWKVAAVILCLFGFTRAKVLSRCELVQQLRKHNVPQKDMADWTCLVEAESSLHTEVRGKLNPNKSQDHGLFQINDRYWCRNGAPGGNCNVKCEDVRSDDLTAAINCALIIKKAQGFNAWYGWKNHCQGKKLPDVSKC